MTFTASEANLDLSMKEPHKPSSSLSRRQFIERTGATVAALAGPWSARPAAATKAKSNTTEPQSSRLPRWRGFNLVEKCVADRNAPFRESDFEWIADWGFDFVRLPMSYRCWTDADNWLKLKEFRLKEIDDAVELGRRHGVHVNLNLHRAPGYCVNPPREPLDLWSDEKALEACAFHWRHLAQRCKGIPNSRLSFDLLNEPGDLPEMAYNGVVKRLVETIRAEDPQRLIIADGLKWGNQPVVSLVEMGIAQSTRGYQPTRISHYKANWMRGSDQWPEPSWPLKISERDLWDKQRLHTQQIDPWKALESQGVGVHVGEWGAFNKTPHKVALAWMHDCLELWKTTGWGWAMWNFRGGFGMLDSERTDLPYENFHGHKLDREMLELVRSY